MNTRTERNFPIPKDVLDTLNSITWFIVDGLWMMGLHRFALVFAVPTIITGLLLLYIEKRPSITCINLAINCWIWMNAFWILFDLTCKQNNRFLQSIN